MATDKACVDTAQKEGPREIFENFAGYTTIFFVPCVITGKSLKIRCFWTVVFVAASSMFVYQLSDLLRRFFDYPVQVTTTITENDVPFPHIRLCNMRPMDMHVTKRLIEEELRGNLTDFLFRNATTGDGVVDEYLKYVGKYYEVYRKFRKVRKMAPLIRELFSLSTIFANLHVDVVYTNAYYANSFVVSSTFAGRNIPSRIVAPDDAASYFITLPDVNYFRCTKFVVENARIKKDGMENGWSTIVLTGSGMDLNITSKRTSITDEVQPTKISEGEHGNGESASGTGGARGHGAQGEDESSDGVEEQSWMDYKKFHAGSDGVRVVIYPPNAYCVPETEGYDVPPRTSASFAVRTRRITRLGRPYGDCNHRNPYAAYIENVDPPYRAITCQKMCVQKRVMDECGCFDAGLFDDVFLMNFDLLNMSAFIPCQYGRDFPDECVHRVDDVCVEMLWRQYALVQCARNLIDRIYNNRTLIDECRCHPACDEIVYDVTYSLAKWPADGPEGDKVMNDIFNAKMFLDRLNVSDADREMYRAYFRRENWPTAKNDFARINVYIADGQMVEMKETPEYPGTNLVADIGGQLGIWVGMSVITISEVLTLAWQLFRYVACRRQRHAKVESTLLEPLQGQQPLPHV